MAGRAQAIISTILLCSVLLIECKDTLRKCCAANEFFVVTDNLNCSDSSGFDFQAQSYQNVNFSDFDIIYGRSCPEDYVSGILSSEIPGFSIKSSGDLVFISETFKYNEYCLDYADNVLMAIACIKPEAENISHSIGMIISIPFLLATIIVYLLLPERNLHMKALICYMFHLMMAYILLVTIQLDSNLDGTMCTFLGCLCLFLFTSSILWLHIICCDIFLTFGGYLGLQGSRRKETKRLIYYMIYGFTVPFCLILITILLNHYLDPSSQFHPGIGNGVCFLKRGSPYLLYLHGPIGFFLLVNAVLFILTALKIRKAKKETKVLKKGENRKTNENDTKKFNLYLKLLLAMGINWTLETISWTFENFTSLPHWVWYVTDFCNAIYGVFIFILFACKKRHWKVIKKKYYQFIGRPHLAASLSTTTQQTRMMSMSETQTNTESTRLSAN